MALPVDGYIPERDDPYRRGTPAYYARLQAMLDAPIQGIAPGIGSLSPEGRPALPTWVQQRLDEQERAEAAREAAAAKRAADLRAARQPEPRRRLFSPLADQDDAELGAARLRRRRQPFSPLAGQDDAELGAAPGAGSAVQSGGGRGRPLRARDAGVLRTAAGDAGRSDPGDRARLRVAVAGGAAGTSAVGTGAAG